MLNAMKWAVLALALALPSGASAEPTEARLRFLMEWAASAMDVPARGLDLPRILLVSHRALQVEVHGAEKVAEAEASESYSLVNIAAAYDIEHGVMLLNRDWDFTDPLREAVVVHEMVHHIQAETGIADDASCIQELEGEAYRVGDLWALAHGGDPVDPFLLLLVTNCPRPDYY